ncbi:AAA family ATPase [Flavobacterium plurextorum]|uniref:AAA family ATPase n=1 Tax=Flavobacterium TaxID=237 RepID=UPI00214D2448|nr:MULTISPECIES: AAA family ATPase [Flavobacterium]UUW08312.1 AAA family ATPase [Flavobacterium plurextorum]
MSTTSTKKELVDFLWEWAESHNDWGKLLIHKVVTSESSLSSTDRQEIFTYFLQSIGQHTGLTAVTNSKPIYKPTDKIIEITKLSEVTGVNRLAKNQTIEFSKNLTAVFGENGTGKTGYGRILKSLGFSYDPNNKILHNIYGTVENKSAKIDYSANGTANSFTWDGTNNNADLANISVFNNHCVQISLSDRQLIVSPIGFHLFNLVTAELAELNNLLIQETAKHPITMAFLPLLTVGTSQHTFITNLSGSVPLQKIEELSAFTDAHAQELKDKELELMGLNKALLETEIKNYNNSVAELKLFANDMRVAQTEFTAAKWQALIELNKEIATLEAQTKKGIKEVAETNGITFYDTPQFQSFIKAAEDYIKIIEKPEYPAEEDTCVYCKQPLESTAKELLESYRTLLNDKTQENLQSFRDRKKTLVDAVATIDTNLILHQHTFGANDDQTAKQPEEIAEYNNVLGTLKESFVKGEVTVDSTFTFDYVKYIKFIEDKETAMNGVLKIKNDSLANIATKETELKNRIAELKDRKLLSTKVQDIKDAVANHKIVSVLNANVSSFNSSSLSRKTTQAREELVGSNFGAIFKSELSTLRKGHINIDVNLSTDRGNSKVSNRISAHTLTDILSEGEQKAIALAEFLAELQLDNIKAPVIFDDPVNSLDHHIIDDVARRLLKLSAERQVVIFTHSVLLFNSLLYFSKQPLFKAIACKLYNSKNEYNETGFITEAAEEKNSVKDYLSKINVIINNTAKDRAEAEVAEDGYGYLRSAIELFVEHEIFCGTVKRYQKNVALTQFVKVDGALLNTHKEKLNEIFERCCGFIKGHSNPAEIYHDPTIGGLKADFDDFKAIRDVFPK